MFRIPSGMPSRYSIGENVRAARHGLSVLELIMTLVIIVMVLTAALGLLNKTTAQITYLDEVLTRQHQAQNCLDRLAEDILAAAGGKMEIKIDRETVGTMNTAHLIIISRSSENQSDTDQQSGYSQIDWVAVPRYEENDLVLFRREMTVPSDEKSMFIPVCENINNFEINLMDQGGDVLDDTTLVELMNIRIEVFLTGSSHTNRLINLERTVCVNRYNNPMITPPPADASQVEDPNNAAQENPETPSTQPDINEILKNVQIPAKK